MHASPGNSFSAVRLTILPLLLPLLGPLHAAATQIDWASTISNSTIANASNALGQPDSVRASSYSGTATFGGFGSGTNINYDSFALASLLDVTTAQLAQADFISVERNGTGGLTYESCTWVFDDGTNSLTLPYTFGSSPSGAIIALGNISNGAYASFFGFTNQFGSTGDWAYLLFDIAGTSSVEPSSVAFSATMSALGTGDDPNSPEPDVMGRMNVPEPGGVELLVIGLLALLFGTKLCRR